MITDENKKEGSNSIDMKSFSLIEKAEEFQWMMRLLILALFIDSAMMVANKKNILSFPWKDTIWINETG